MRAAPHSNSAVSSNGNPRSLAFLALFAGSNSTFTHYCSNKNAGDQLVRLKEIEPEHWGPSDEDEARRRTRMRAVAHEDEIGEDFARCRSEAAAAFGDGSLYAERKIMSALSSNSILCFS